MRGIDNDPLWSFESHLMCGILGFLEQGGRLPEPGLFARCLEELRNRGPDDAGLWSDARVRLGHRRLAVVDLSPMGHQPMESGDGRYVIVFNGEIYNHSQLRGELDPAGGWRGTSDTETLLEAYRAWGTACLGRLNGMFAFAIWDKTERRLFLARDRMGVKPLYYAAVNGAFAFASRPRAILPLFDRATAEPDPEALRLYLELGYIPAPLSYYRHVRKLRPAHYAVVDSSGVKIARYWDFRHIAPDPGLMLRPEGELIEELDALIRDSVRLRLMSDVPFGAMLSGGVDSAMIVAAMKAAGGPTPKAFTIAFEEKAYDEGPQAAATAAVLGVEHVTETMRLSDLLNLLPLYVEESDEPFADSSSFPTMAVARLARAHVTVALTGDAGDELFGGYHYYRVADRLAQIMRWPRPVQRLLRSVLNVAPSHRARLLAGALRVRPGVHAFNYLRSFGKDFPPLLAEKILHQTNSSAEWFEDFAGSFANDLSSAESGMRLDMGFMLPNGYLHKVDMATMAFSLEARCPLTDFRLVEWSMRLPFSYKMRGGQDKYLLKKTLCRYLPPEHVYRKKRGFGVPIAEWLRGPLLSWAKDLLHDESILSRLPLDRQRMRHLFQLHVSGTRQVHPMLWSILMLLCFVARHDAKFELPQLPLRRAA
jgi:asparagine synthase (glutamine-hydrolysing)